ncbi:GNAT family N-acetyltransferase [Herbaspirillum sp. RTI4]|uniref:GNAT family N-acetyltransferase n=1 Tax=Herbaspirillum sp. RTI4 TaxID=3048640 RepID=UPI002AB57A10|nr:GNAT family N-acetyltransferase [Herbaspirillum sp. RTI4]MDY7579986.1 GNAT family N-acetyltransferase [Herbaspirillum sp. RTI4]MEA9982801.1 GNAT family N-acetyltransferase [Herbaspirillum sp. RTI4]
MQTEPIHSPNYSPSHSLMQTESSELEWQWIAFSDMTARQLYEVMILRQRIFLIEQNCVYQDADGLDSISLHGCGRTSAGIQAYARIVPPHTACPQPAIGRVLVTPSWRSRGTGSDLMRRALAQSERLYCGRDIALSAQFHLQEFYGRLGFRAVGSQYDDAGIPHIDMLRVAPSLSAQKFIAMASR